MARYLGLIVLAATIFVACVFAEEDEERYSDKYDYVLVDIRGILNNNRKRHQYEACFMDLGPCLTGDAVFMKKNLPEAMVTKCRKCTDRQREAFSVTADWYAENDPETWNKIIRQAVEDFTAKGVLRRLKEREERMKKEREEREELQDNEKK